MRRRRGRSEEEGVPLRAWAFTFQQLSCKSFCRASFTSLSFSLREPAIYNKQQQINANNNNKMKLSIRVDLAADLAQ